MKTYLLTMLRMLMLNGVFAFLFSLAAGLNAQVVTRMPVIGEEAPKFTAKTTHGDIHFPDDFYGKWTVFFSHPGAFTPVCTSEFMEFESRISEFNDINCKLLGLSTDNVNTLYEWVKTIRDEIEFKGKKNLEISFPIIADHDKLVSQKYGMIHPAISSEKTVRSLFIVDPDGVIRLLMYYPLSTGRSVDEVLRVVKALQVTEEYNVATPSSWVPGEDVFIPLPMTGSKESKEYSEAWDKDHCPAWFMCLKAIPLDELNKPKK